MVYARREIKCVETLRPWLVANRGGLPLVLRAVTQCVVGQHQGGHGLDHRDGAREDARIVAAAALEGRVFQQRIDGVLFVHDGGYRLEGDTEVDGLTVGNAALHAA